MRGSFGVSTAVFLRCLCSTPWQHLDLSLCVFRALAFLQVMPHWHSGFWWVFLLLQLFTHCCLICPPHSRCLIPVCWSSHTMGVLFSRAFCRSSFVWSSMEAGLTVCEDINGVVLQRIDFGCLIKVLLTPWNKCACIIAKFILIINFNFNFNAFASFWPLYKKPKTSRYMKYAESGSLKITISVVLMWKMWNHLSTLYWTILVHHTFSE